MEKQLRQILSFWFVCFCSNNLLLCNFNFWCISDCGSGRRAWFGQGRDWHGQSQLEIPRACTLSVCRHWDLRQGNQGIVKSYKWLLILVTLIQDWYNGNSCLSHVLHFWRSLLRFISWCQWKYWCQTQPVRRGKGQSCSTWSLRTSRY